MMPAHFGMPNYDSPPSLWYHGGMMVEVSYITDRERLAALLPEPFSVADEALISVSYGHSGKVDWLAGRSYNIISVNAAVKFDGKEDQLEGRFSLVLWENLADAILTGREQIGIPKIFADIPDYTFENGEYRCSASHFGSGILDMSMANLTPLSAEEIAAAQEARAATDNQMGWRYIPAVGGFGAQVSEPVIYPSETVVIEAHVGVGSVEWNRLTWEQNPTQFHIVNALADLPILEYRPSAVVKGDTNLFFPERWPRILR
jgi:acetoacetate decarboxylase